MEYKCKNKRDYFGIPGNFLTKIFDFFNIYWPWHEILNMFRKKESKKNHYKALKDLKQKKNSVETKAEFLNNEINNLKSIINRKTNTLVEKQEQLKGSVKQVQELKDKEENCSKRLLELKSEEEKYNKNKDTYNEKMQLSLRERGNILSDKNIREEKCKLDAYVNKINNIITYKQSILLENATVIENRIKELRIIRGRMDHLNKHYISKIIKNKNKEEYYIFEKAFIANNEVVLSINFEHKTLYATLDKIACDNEEHPKMYTCFRIYNHDINNNTNKTFPKDLIMENNDQILKNLIIAINDEKELFEKIKSGKIGLLNNDFVIDDKFVSGNGPNDTVKKAFHENLKNSGRVVTLTVCNRWIIKKDQNDDKFKFYCPKENQYKNKISTKICPVLYLCFFENTLKHVVENYKAFNAKYDVILKEGFFHIDTKDKNRNKNNVKAYFNTFLQKGINFFDFTTVENFTKSDVFIRTLDGLEISESNCLKYINNLYHIIENVKPSLNKLSMKYNECNDEKNNQVTDSSAISNFLSMNRKTREKFFKKYFKLNLCIDKCKKIPESNWLELEFKFANMLKNYFGASHSAIDCDSKEETPTGIYDYQTEFLTLIKDHLDSEFKKDEKNQESIPFSLEYTDDGDQEKDYKITSCYDKKNNNTKRIKGHLLNKNKSFENRIAQAAMVLIALKSRQEVSNVALKVLNGKRFRVSYSSCLRLCQPASWYSEMNMLMYAVFHIFKKTTNTYVRNQIIMAICHAALHCKDGTQKALDSILEKISPNIYKLFKEFVKSKNDNRTKLPLCGLPNFKNMLHVMYIKYKEQLLYDYLYKMVKDADGDLSSTINSSYNLLSDKFGVSKNNHAEDFQLEHAKAISDFDKKLKTPLIKNTMKSNNFYEYLGFKNGSSGTSARNLFIEAAKNSIGEYKKFFTNDFFENLCIVYLCKSGIIALK